MTQDEMREAQTQWEQSLPRGKTINPDMAFAAGYSALLPALVEARDALTQILDDGDHISDYIGAEEGPVFNRNEKQGSYCYAAAEQAMKALASLNTIIGGKDA